MEETTDPVSAIKNVYFVRHGESEANARTQPTYKGRHSPLTEHGRAQAERIAARAAKLPFEVLIASPWQRTKETAEAISRMTGKPIEYSEYFTETRSPSSLIGMPAGTPELGERLRAWSHTLFSDAPPIEDGENFAAVFQRGKDALAHLAERPEHEILVSTHGLFLRVLMSIVLIGDTLAPAQLYHFLAGSKTDNTGISIFQYGAMPTHEADQRIRWRLRVFNDHAHLA